jgi:hypothetical protein
LQIDPEVHFLWEGNCAYPWREVPRVLYDSELVFVSRGAFVLTVGDQTFEIGAEEVARLIGRANQVACLTGSNFGNWSCVNQ